MELYNATKLHVSQNELPIFRHKPRQAHNSTTAIIVSCCCRLLHSTGSSNSVASEFILDFYYLADW